ncbi:SbcC/MukB-like Walker B domain-containing protein [Methylomonas sp. YC3]
MRILAIRGKNLASLAEPFEVSLNDGPLAQVGLFAITGQTGAGKSTILDALCLALYDKIPRLPDGHGIAVGHKDEDENLRVTTTDVRSILRKGTSSGFAEVDFIGKDKQQYRARWEVTKARGKVDGRLQSQDVKLTNIATGQIIGQGKKSTLEAISDLIDLSFEQFRRSVLLAQGDFAAFLKAKKDERSSLLERITGTEIYSDLSIAAFDRARDEKDALNQIIQKLQNQIPLEASARQEIEQQRDLLINQLADLDKQIEGNQKIIDWYVKLKKLQEAEQTARTDFNVSQTAWNNAEPDRQLLQTVEAIQPLRPLVSQFENATAEHQDAQQKQIASSEQQQAAESKLQNAKELLKTQSDQFDAAEQQQKQAQPLLIQVRALDTRIDVIQKTVDSLTTEEEQLKNAYDQANADHKKLLAQQAEQTEKLEKLTAWMAQNAATKVVAKEWSRWESELDRYQKLSTQKAEAEDKTEQLNKAIATDQQRLDELTTAIAEDNGKLNQHTETLNQLKSQEALHSLEELLHSKQDFETKRDQISKAVALVKNALETSTTIQQTNESLQLNEKAVDENIKNLGQATQQQSENSIALIEAKRALALIEASNHKSAEQFRTLLQDNEHCPVCGALEHPWKDHPSFGNEQIAGQQQRVADLEKTNETLVSKIAELNKSISFANQLKQELTEKLGLAKAKLNEYCQEWSQLIVPNKPDLLITDHQLLPALQAQLDGITSALVTVKAQEKSALELQALIKAEQGLFDVVKLHKEKLSDEHTNLDKQFAKNQTELTNLETSIQAFDDQMGTILILLATPFNEVENWKVALQASITEFRTDWSGKVAQLIHTEQELEQAQKALDKFVHEAKLAAQRVEQSQVQHDNKKTELDSQSKQLDSLKQERLSLLPMIDGKPLSADSYEQTSQQNVSTAKNAVQQASQNVSAAETELATQKQNLLHWQAETDRRVGNLENARIALEKELHKHSVELPQLKELLRKDDAWIAEQKAALQNLEKSLKENEALLKVKTADRQEHQKQSAAVPEADALKLSGELQGQKQTLSSQKEEIVIRIREDDQRLESGRQLKIELDAQQQTWERWESINELIGSKSGAKFRTFAQSLTLEALLTYSNQHLQDFAKRYVLQRVPGSDLELQIIDRDMADDVRSVHSLSGGESFLVSLALALGLASLSSNKTQVESLFIDEGFGSLDPETLDIAIASLDTLQALGRKVGVISHVPILVERIGAKVVVEKLGGGRSGVRVVGV